MPELQLPENAWMQLTRFLANGRHGPAVSLKQADFADALQLRLAMVR